MEYKINKKLSYMDAVAELEEVIDKLDIYQRPDLVKRFALFSANVQYFMPEIPLDEHEGYFRHLCLQQHLAHLDQNHPQALEVLDIQETNVLLQNLWASGPAIICTYHTGSYRFINKLLMQKEMPFVLLIAGNVLGDEGCVFQRVFREMCPKAPKENFQLIDAQDPSALLKLLRALAKGMKIVVYVDGNTGTGDTVSVKNSCEVKFFGKKLVVRAGVAMLSYLSGAPIFPLLCKRLDKSGLAFKLENAIVPDNGLLRNDFVQVTMQHLYASLEALVRENLALWEGWSHVHQYVNDNGGDICLPERLLKAIQAQNIIV